MDRMRISIARKFVVRAIVFVVASVLTYFFVTHSWIGAAVIALVIAFFVPLVAEKMSPPGESG